MAEILDPFEEARKRQAEASAREASGYNPTIQTAPTVSDVYGNINYETPEERAFREGIANEAKTVATTPIDEESIRRDTLAKFQSEIDALNRVYADKKLAEQIAGRGRMGQVGAIEARRGLLGSDFGVAQERGQEMANQSVLDSIENERAAAQSAILKEARNTSAKEIADKTAAKKLGAEEYLKYIQESAGRRKTNTEEYAKKLYESGTYNEGTLKGIADNLGVSVEALKSAYETYKKTADEAKALAEQEALKVQAEEDKKVTTENLKREQDLLKEGYIYVKTPAERDALKKQGYQIVEIAGRTYSKEPEYTTKTVKIGSTTYNLTTDKMGNVIKKEALGGSGGGTAPTNTEKAALTEMTSALSGVAGADGFISPQDYTELRNQWAQAGLNPTTFDTKFKGYRNPNNPNYITNKQ